MSDTQAPTTDSQPMELSQIEEHGRLEHVAITHAAQQDALVLAAREQQDALVLAAREQLLLSIRADAAARQALVDDAAREKARFPAGATADEIRNIKRREQGLPDWVPLDVFRAQKAKEYAAARQ